MKVDRPETLYAWNGEDALAYQVVGEGPVDLVYIQGFGSNVIVNWEHPAFARFAREVARRCRLGATGDFRNGRLRFHRNAVRGGLPRASLGADSS